MATKSKPCSVGISFPFCAVKAALYLRICPSLFFRLRSIATLPKMTMIPSVAAMICCPKTSQSFRKAVCSHRSPIIEPGTTSSGNTKTSTSSFFAWLINCNTFFVFKSGRPAMISICPQAILIAIFRASFCKRYMRCNYNIIVTVKTGFEK